MQSGMLVCPLVVCVSRQPSLRRPMSTLLAGVGAWPVVRKSVTHNTGGVA